VAITLTGLTKRFGPNLVANDISLILYKAEMLVVPGSGGSFVLFHFIPEQCFSYLSTAYYLRERRCSHDFSKHTV